MPFIFFQNPTYNAILATLTNPTLAGILLITMAKTKQRQNLNKVLSLLKLLNKDKRYDRAAYSFVMASLDFITKKLGRKGHVSGGELLEGIREYALEQYGPLARTVLEHWGIQTTNDVGEIVFNLIESEILGKTEQDTKDEFDNSFDFKTAFDKGYKYTLL